MQGQRSLVLITFASTDAEHQGTFRLWGQGGMVVGAESACLTLCFCRVVCLLLLFQSCSRLVKAVLTPVHLD